MSASWWATPEDMKRKSSDPTSPDRLRRALEQQIDRYWMKKATGREIVFVDEGAPRPVNEHNPCIGQGAARWQNWMTCSNGPDAACCSILGRGYVEAAGYGRYTVKYYTIVDCTGYKSRTGNEYRFLMTLFAAKSGTELKLRTKITDHEGIAGKLFKANRYGIENEPAVGGEHSFLRVANMEGLFQNCMFNGAKLSALYDEADKDEGFRRELASIFNIEVGAGNKLVRTVPAFNYLEVLAPPSEDRIREILKGFVPAHLLNQTPPQDQPQAGQLNTAGTMSGATSPSAPPFAGPPAATDKLTEDEVPF